MANEHSKGPVFESAPGWGGKLQSWLSKNMLYVVPGLVIIIIIIVIASTSGGSENNAELLESSGSPLATVGSTPMPGSIEVLKGDSYTYVARRAVTFIVLTKSTMVPAGARLYAETKLVADIDDQPLVPGNFISVPNDKISTYLNEYNSLYPTQIAKWEAMAKNIKF